MSEAHDRFWEFAMRGAHLNAIEQAALLDLVVDYVERGQRDRMWALVPVLRDDGAAQMLPLTIDRVEAYAADYEMRGFSIEASTEPG